MDSLSHSRRHTNRNQKKQPSDADDSHYDAIVSEMQPRSGTNSQCPPFVRSREE